VSDVQGLLEEINGRLTATGVKYPDTRNFLRSFQKHVDYALKNPSRADYPKLLRKGRDWLSTVMWKHPTFRDDFAKMVDAIDKFKEEHGG
jgi:hypothetical protein